MGFGPNPLGRNRRTQRRCRVRREGSVPGVVRHSLVAAEQIPAGASSGPRRNAPNGIPCKVCGTRGRLHQCVTQQFAISCGFRLGPAPWMHRNARRRDFACPSARCARMGRSGFCSSALRKAHSLSAIVKGLWSLRRSWAKMARALGPRGTVLSPIL